MSQEAIANKELLATLEKVTKTNNRLGISTAVGFFIPVIFLITALISPFAIYKSRKLKRHPIVQEKLKELSVLNQYDLKVLSNSASEDALFAKFKRTYLNAYAPILIFVLGAILIAAFKH